MRLTTARQSIHDAFAIHLGGPIDNIGGGAAKFNSTRWLANAGLAGFIIRAVMNQPAHLRGTAVYMNAPENTVTLADIIAMKSAVWTTFIQSGPVSAEDQGVLVAYIDRIFGGYRIRAWNAKARHTGGAMFAGFADRDGSRLCRYANRIIDVLAGLDSESLKPVWEVIDMDEKEALSEMVRMQRLKKRITERAKTTKTWVEARDEVKAEDEAAD